MITVNITFTKNTVNVTSESSAEKKTKRSRLWVAVVTWAGAIAATLAVLGDAFGLVETLRNLFF